MKESAPGPVDAVLPSGDEGTGPGLVRVQPVDLAPETPEQLAITRAPEVVLAEAQRAARALKDVLDAKPRKVIFNDEQYLEFEDWQTLGRFYGVTCKVERTAFVEYGEVHGFTATAVALRADGAVISQAEAECLSDEPKWRSRPVYEWSDTPHGRRRMRVGEEPVPLFQLKSMAQTRACAKCLRNVLAWVVVLAGYRPTPAEELPAETVAKRPSKRSASTTRPRVITNDQRKKLNDVAKEAGWSVEALRQELAKRFHVERSADIRSRDFQSILAVVAAGPVPVPAAEAVDQPF